MRENQELGLELERLQAELGSEKVHNEESGRKFSSMISKIFQVLKSVQDGIEQGEEDPADALEFVYEKIESILKTLDHYPFNHP